MWEKILDQIRQGNVPVDIGNNGLPELMRNAPYFEQMQFTAALAAGYMRNYNRVCSLRNAVNSKIHEMGGK